MQESVHFVPQPYTLWFHNLYKHLTIALMVEKILDLVLKGSLYPNLVQA